MKEAEEEEEEENAPQGGGGFRTMELQYGDKLILVCPGATASSVVTWKLNGKMFGVGGGKEPSPVDALGTLNIDEVGAKDAGSYACAVDGIDSAVVGVTVELPPFIKASGLVRKCFQCRSRGDLGTCKDPFTYNATSVQDDEGVEAVPCASGWCGKFLEGGSTFKDDDYGMATQRLCLQRGPSDSEERCAYTKWSNKEVFMCFCLGDLCNASSRFSSSLLAIFSTILLGRFLLWQ